MMGLSLSAEVHETETFGKKLVYLRFGFSGLALVFSLLQLQRTSVVAGSHFLLLDAPCLLVVFAQVRSPHPSSHHLPSLTGHAQNSNSVGCSLRKFVALMLYTLWPMPSAALPEQ